MHLSKTLKKTFIILSVLFLFTPLIPTSVLKAADAQSLEFKDTSYLEISPSSTVEFSSGSGTIEAWINPKTYNTTIINRWGKQGLNNASYFLGLASSGSVYFATYRYNGPYDHKYTRMNSTKKIPLNTWTHITIVMDGKNAKLYLNGALDSTTALVIPQPSTLPVFIGKKGDGYNNFIGHLDEIKFFNEPRNQEQIISDMQAHSTEPSMNGYWNFEEFIGDSTMDNSGNGNHAKMVDTNKSNETPIKPQIKIELDPTNLDLYIGDEPTQINVTVIPSNIPLIWESLNPEVADVDEDGMVTPISEGDAEIVVSTEDRSIKQSAFVHVTSAEVKALIPSEESLLLQPKEKMKPLLKAIYSNGKEKDISKLVQWISDNNDVAKISNGYVIAVNSGTTTLSTEYEGVSISIKVEVEKSESQINALFLEKEFYELNVDDVIPYTITAKMQDGEEKDVTFDESVTINSSDSSIVAIERGLIQAVSEGEAELSIEYEDKLLTVPVTVQNSKVVSLTPSRKSVQLTTESPIQQITLTAKLEDGTNKDVTDLAEWSSSNSQIAEVESGKIIGKKSGIATIAVKYQGKTTYISVKVQESGKLTKLIPSVKSLDLSTGQKVNILISGLYSNGQTKELTKNTLLKWKSANPAILEASNGIVTAKKIGKTEIILTLGNTSTKIRVTVSETKVINIRSSLKEIKLKKNQTSTISVQAKFSDGKTIDVTKRSNWTIKNKAIATVKNGVVKGIKSGKTYITATYNNKSIKIAITVK